jgi:ferrous iron transport protein A
MNLSETPVGSSVLVRSAGDGSLAATQRLEDLGFVPGTVVRVERRAPLHDPVLFVVRGTRLAMRRRDVATIEVQPLVDVVGHTYAGGEPSRGDR